MTDSEAISSGWQKRQPEPQNGHTPAPSEGAIHRENDAQGHIIDIDDGLSDDELMLHIYGNIINKIGNMKKELHSIGIDLTAELE